MDRTLGDENHIACFDMMRLLTDRVRIAEGKPQVYGTQGQTNPDGVLIPFPIEDEEHVDERPKAIGLEPIVEYFKNMNERYKTNSE